MKKVMTVLLLVLVLASIMVQPVAAAGMQPSMTASTQSVKPGDTIDFNVSMSSSAACDQFGLQLQYDSDVFEVVSGVCTVSAAGEDGDDMVAVKVFDKGRGFAVSFFGPVTFSGKVGKFTLRVKDSAPGGSTTVGFKSAANNGPSAVDIGTTSVTITVAGSSVVDPTEPEVTDPKPTDTQPTEPKPTEHKHTYSNKWSSDRNQHWHECTGCGEKKDVKKHTPGPEATEAEHQRCTVCNYVIKQALGHTHDYGDEWLFDESRHWHICECGQKTDIANHTWDSEGNCKKCDAKKVEETTPEETTAPAETTQPTVESTAPTQETEPEETEELPTQEPTEPEDKGFTDEQWSTGGLILALVVAAAIVAYFLIVQKRQGQ